MPPVTSCPVVEMRFEFTGISTGAILHAATALGDATALDLEIFDRPYCELLAALGKEHPYRWEEGQVRRVDSSKRRAGLAPGCQSGSK